jgi:hypothetical protein
MRIPTRSQSSSESVALDSFFNSLDSQKHDLITREPCPGNLQWLFLVPFVYSYWRMQNRFQYTIARFSIRFPFPFHTHHIFVTAYWQGPSKHTQTEYTFWIRRFLSIFVGQLYFYTTPLTWEFLINETLLGSNIHQRFNYTDAYQIPCMSPLRSVYAAQWRIDPEKRIHQPRLYAVWNGKLCLLSEISLINPAATVFWIDAGSCREKQYQRIKFPNPGRIISIVKPETKGSMIFTMWRYRRFRRPGFMRFFREVYVIGGFFGGDQAALRKYSLGFWAIHDYFLKENYFIGKDQHIMSTYLVYADEAWVQPNYQARCNSWFSTFSFYTNTTICFAVIPQLLPHTTYFDSGSTWTFSLDIWRSSIRIPFHSFGR